MCEPKQQVPITNRIGPAVRIAKLDVSARHLYCIHFHMPAGKPLQLCVLLLKNAGADQLACLMLICNLLELHDVPEERNHIAKGAKLGKQTSNLETPSMLVKEDYPEYGDR